MNSPIKIELSRGTLKLSPEKTSDWELDELLGFAERLNPKRAFLFVSKVLGRHIPVDPKIIRKSFTDLANLVPNNLPEPVLVIGMAETAVGLGAGVHQVLTERYPNAIFVSTTRHPVPNAPLLSSFLEEHSHAQDQLLYGSPDPLIHERILNSRSIVLVDDEASTGKTFVNLVASLNEAGLKQVSNIVTATLADWSNGISIPNIQCDSVSLLKGRWDWVDSSNPQNIEMPKVDTVNFGDYACLEKPTWGRLPTYNTLAYSKVRAKKSERILVLGSGEYVWPPFLMAENLAKQGANVEFSAITRSPIAIGHSIEKSLVFGDNYGLGIQNFVYNVHPENYDRILIAVETVSESVSKDLLSALPNAQIVSAVDYSLEPEYIYLHPLADINDSETLNKTNESPDNPMPYVDPICLVDLDDTLFQTHRRLNPTDGFKVATTDRNGQPLAFMTPIQQNFAHWLLNNTLTIPVTARSVEALSRVNFDFKHGAVCSHGGTVLNPDKSVNQEWYAHIESILSDYQPRFKAIIEAIKTMGERIGSIRTWIVEDQGVSLYLVAKQNTKENEAHSPDLLPTLLKSIDQSLLTGFYFHLNGNNLAIIPEPVSKANAVEFLLNNLNLNDHPVIGYGDSLSDVAFLNKCHWWGVPQKSQIGRWANTELNKQYSENGYFGEYNNA